MAAHRAGQFAGALDGFHRDIIAQLPLGANESTTTPLARIPVTWVRSIPGMPCYGQSMKSATIFLGAALAAWGAHHAWQTHERAVIDRKLDAIADVYGFVPVRMPDGAPKNTVLILAPINCPSDGAQRADALEAKLQSLGIPSQRLNQYSVAGARAEDREPIERAFNVMSGTIPAVMINGQARANPSIDEVTGEFHKLD